MVLAEFLAGLGGLIALLLAVVTFVTYRRAGHRRFLFVGLAFLAFALRLGWVALALVAPARVEAPPLVAALALDLASLGLLYLALMQPTEPRTGSA